MLNVVGLYAGEWKFSKKSKVMILGRGAGRWKLCRKELLWIVLNI